MNNNLKTRIKNCKLLQGFKSLPCLIPSEQELPADTGQRTLLFACLQNLDRMGPYQKRVADILPQILKTQCDGTSPTIQDQTHKYLLF